ncbi:MAG: response regulator transcription factor [Bacillota bacterium]|nr:response regulator transcription factor [Bacillota bacterium]
MIKILIIEDDPSIAGLMRDYLEVAGFSADLCLSGNKGLEAIRTTAYDLILLDLMLPGLDGYDILRQTRSQTAAPILIVSARQEDIDKIKGLSLGADDYITKPFSPGELTARVKAHLAYAERLKKHYATPEPRTIKVRGLEVQPEDRRIFINGQEISLAAKEYDLLLFLVRHPNHVFSKEALFEQVWGLDAIGDTSTVTVHIARIREKIEVEPTGMQYIETVWGVGYRLRA